jgi:DNA polymerase III epsilon subunit family exonuclease
MKAGHRFLIAVIVLGLLMTGPFWLTALLLAADLKPEEVAVLRDILLPRLPLGVFFTIIGFIFGVQVLRALFRQYVHGLSRMAESLRLMRDANRSFRVSTDGPPEVKQLADAANDLARQRDAMCADVEARIAQARAVAEEERNRLAALVADLPQAVIVCNLDGRIILYNNRARLQARVLAPDAHAAGAVIGLGRSIHAVLDPVLISRALETLQHRLERAGSQPLAHFVTSTRGGQHIRVQMSPVLSATQPASNPTIGGYVMTLENISREAAEHHGDQVTDASEPGHAAAVSLLHVESRPEFYDFDLFRRAGEDHAHDDRPLTELTYTAFDTETTGLEPSAGDEIIQIGAVRIVNGRVLRYESMDQLIDPQRPLKAASIKIHGIREEMVAGQPTIDVVLPQFHRFAEDTVLVAHNAAFDMRFLQLKEASTGIRFTQPVLDTLLLSAVVHPNQESHKLEAIAERLGIPIIGRHNALGDAIVTAEVFLRMVGLLGDMGIRTLGQVRAAAEKTYYARIKY